MRPRASIMLQQNNNNNYPCLKLSGSSQEMLQKCTRALLPFPMADLPVIRGLRAWALCSRSRRKAGGLLGGGQAPTAPLAGRGSSKFCPRPADVYLSEEWGRMGCRPPLGVDARQAGLGGLVTVATLKTSEGSGKTQTQCLFVRTEKGNCLYSKAKLGCGTPSCPASGGVGGWLREKTGGGGRHNGTTFPGQTRANRVRVQSGRRWRRSGSAAGLSKDRQQREAHAGQSSVQEQQEDQDKGGRPAIRHDSSEQDSKQSREDKDVSPGCCHGTLAKSCCLCGGRPQQQEGQESLRKGVFVPDRQDGELKEEQKTTRDEEEEKGLSWASNANVEEKTQTEPRTALKTQISVRADMFSEKDITKPEMGLQNRQTSLSLVHDPSEPDGVTDGFTWTQNQRFSDRKTDTENGCVQTKAAGHPFKDTAADINGCFDGVDPVRESEQEEQSFKTEEEEEDVFRDPPQVSVLSSCCENVFVSDLPTSVSNSASLPTTTETSAPVGGSTCTAGPGTGGGHGKEGNKEDLGVNGHSCGNNTVFETLDKSGRDTLGFFENNNHVAERNASSSPVRQVDRHTVSSTFETDRTVAPGARDDCSSIVTQTVVSEDNGGEVKTNCVLTEESAGGFRGRLEEDRRHVGLAATVVETSGPVSPGPQTTANVTNVVHADPSTSPSLHPVNPPPPLPRLSSMATGLPCVEAEGFSVTTRPGQEGKKEKQWQKSELESPEEEQGEEVRGSTVATEETRKEEDEDEEFGVFVQAEGEPSWSEGFAASASVPSGSRENAGWTNSSFHQSEDTWTAFPQHLLEEGGDITGQWWPTSAVEEKRANQNLAAVFVVAFPSLPALSSSEPCDRDTVPTLSQLLSIDQRHNGASQDQGLLDTFHDLNKMIGRRYRRANGVSRDLLLKTLHLQKSCTEDAPSPATANHRLSPHLPSATQHTQLAAAKRRLSYDYNRNIME